MSEETTQTHSFEAELIYNENLSCVPGEEDNTESTTDEEGTMSGENRTEIEINLKEARLQQWRDAIEADLQVLIVDAAKIRKNITEATTKYKKEYYTKKFNKVSAQVRQYIAALQRLGSPILPEGTDNGNDASTVE